MLNSGGICACYGGNCIQTSPAPFLVAHRRPIVQHIGLTLAKTLEAFIPIDLSLLA